MYNIIYDVDDCLIDTNGYICEKLGLDINDFTNWDLTELKDRDKVFDMYNKVEPYINAKVFNGVQQIRRFGWDVKFHTGCSNLACGLAKKNRLTEMGFKESDIILDYNKEKQMKDCVVQIEDGFENLSRSNALYKILINKPWNEKCIINSTDKIYRVDSLLEANQKVREIMYMHHFDKEQEIRQWMI